MSKEEMCTKMEKRIPLKKRHKICTGLTWAHLILMGRMMVVVMVDLRVNLIERALY